MTSAQIPPPTTNNLLPPNISLFQDVITPNVAQSAAQAVKNSKISQYINESQQYINKTNQMRELLDKLRVNIVNKRLELNQLLKAAHNPNLPYLKTENSGLLPENDTNMIDSNFLNINTSSQQRINDQIMSNAQSTTFKNDKMELDLKPKNLNITTGPSNMDFSQTVQPPVNQLNNFQPNIAKSENQIEQLLLKLEDINIKVTNELSELTNQASEALQIITQLKHDMNITSKSIDESESNPTSTNSTYSTLSSDIAPKENNSTYQGNFQHLKQQQLSKLSANEQQLNELKASVKSYYEEEMAKVTQKYESQIQELHTQLEQITANDSTYQENIKNLENQLQQNITTNQELQSNNNANQETIKNLESELAEVTNNSNKTIQDLQTELETTKNNYSTQLEAAQIEHKTTIENLTQKANDFYTSYIKSEKGKDAQKYKQAIQNLKKKVESTPGKLQDVANFFNEATELKIDYINQKYQKELDLETKKNADLEAQITDLTGQINSLNKDKSDLLVDVDTFRKDTKELQSLYSVEKKVAELTREMNTKLLQKRGPSNPLEMFDQMPKYAKEPDSKRRLLNNTGGQLPKFVGVIDPSKVPMGRVRTILGKKKF